MIFCRAAGIDRWQSVFGNLSLAICHWHFTNTLDYFRSYPTFNLPLIQKTYSKAMGNRGRQKAASKIII